MQEKPHPWDKNEDHKASRNNVCSMRVVNDIVEQPVALIEKVEVQSRYCCFSGFVLYMVGNVPCALRNIV